MAAMLGLAVYWSQVGFRLADTLGWIGAVVGIGGLALAVYGVAARGGGSREEPARVQMDAKASGQSRIHQAGRDQTNNEK